MVNLSLIEFKVRPNQKKDHVISERKIQNVKVIASYVAKDVTNEIQKGSVRWSYLCWWFSRWNHEWYSTNYFFFKQLWEHNWIWCSWRFDRH